MPPIADIYRFLSKLTVVKIWNAVMLVLSFYWMRLTGQIKIWGQPMTLSVEPTTACNLRCPECPSGLRSFTRPTGNIKDNHYRHVISQLKDRLIYLIFYFQGEPFIHPDFLSMVCHAHEQGLYTITSTNGHFLHDDLARQTVESGLDRLIISVDGTTQKVYEQYRKSGNLEQVLDGARNIIKWKKKLKSSSPQVIFQMLVVRPNEHQIDELKVLAKQVGVDQVKLKTAQIYDYEQGHELIPTIDRYSRYIQKSDGSYRTKHSLDNACWKMWHSSLVTWDGRVVPCCFDKDATHELGSTKDQSFADIWRGEKYRAFRSQIQTGRDQIDICTNCSEGCKVFY